MCDPPWGSLSLGLLPPPSPSGQPRAACGSQTLWLCFVWLPEAAQLQLPTWRSLRLDT